MQAVDDELDEFGYDSSGIAAGDDLSYTLNGLSVSSAPFDWGSGGGALTPRSARQKASNEASRGLLDEGSSPRAWLESAYGPSFDPDKLFTAGEISADARDSIGRSYHRRAERIAERACVAAYH